MTRTFTRIDGNEEFWILYEPKRYKSGKIKFTSWVDHIQTPEKEKQYILALEEADKKQKEADDAQIAIDDAKKKAEEEAEAARKKQEE